MRRTNATRGLLALAALVVAALTMLAGAATASAASSPSIESESASGITQTDATLEAQINPSGAYTAYEFQIARSSNYDYTRMACPLSLPGAAQCLAIVVGSESLPPGVAREPSQGSIPAGTGDQSVSLDLASIGATLQPGTTYHYRVIASNGGGPVVYGADQTFMTPATNAPLIESESLSHLTPTDATLEAQIDTEGLETTYQFKMWASPCSHHGSGCELMMNVPLPSGSRLGSFVDQSVSLDLSAAGVTLTPGGEYGYSVTATNAAGSVEGAWHHFEPPLDSAPSIESESASNITATDATLEAQINPNGLETSYLFRLEYGCFSTGAACFAIAEKYLPTEEILASSEAQSVSVDLNGAGVTLHPGWEYRYSVEATNSAGTAQGADQTFTTPSESPGPVPLDAQGPDGSAQSSLAIQSPPAVSSSPHRKHRRRHKRGPHGISLHRAARTG